MGFIQGYHVASNLRTNFFFLVCLLSRTALHERVEDADTRACWQDPESRHLLGHDRCCSMLPELGCFPELLPQYEESHTGSNTMWRISLRVGWAMCQHFVAGTKLQRGRHCLDIKLKKAAEDDALEASLQASLEAETARLHGLETFTCRLYSACQLFPVDVKGDGNCGVWALMTAFGLCGEPQLTLLKGASAEDMNHKDMMSFRAKLADMWREVAGDLASAKGTLFGNLFSVMIPGEAEAAPAEAAPAEAAPAEAAPAEAAPGEAAPAPSAPVTPPKDPKASLANVYRDFTPPRVNAVGRKRPGSGLVCERVSSGASLPINLTLSSGPAAPYAQTKDVKDVKVKTEPPDAQKTLLKVVRAGIRDSAVKLEPEDQVSWIKSLGWGVAWRISNFQSNLGVINLLGWGSTVYIVYRMFSDHLKVRPLFLSNAQSWGYWGYRWRRTVYSRRCTQDTQGQIGWTLGFYPLGHRMFDKFLVACRSPWLLLDSVAPWRFDIPDVFCDHFTQYILGIPSRLLVGLVLWKCRELEWLTRNLHCVSAQGSRCNSSHKKQGNHNAGAADVPVKMEPEDQVSWIKSLGWGVAWRISNFQSNLGVINLLGWGSTVYIVYRMFSDHLKVRPLFLSNAQSWGYWGYRWRRTVYSRRCTQDTQGQIGWTLGFYPLGHRMFDKFLVACRSPWLLLDSDCVVIEPAPDVPIHVPRKQRVANVERGKRSAALKLRRQSESPSRPRLGGRKPPGAIWAIFNWKLAHGSAPTATRWFCVGFHNARLVAGLLSCNNWCMVTCLRPANYAWNFWKNIILRWRPFRKT